MATLGTHLMPCTIPGRILATANWDSTSAKRRTYASLSCRKCLWNEWQHFFLLWCPTTRNPVGLWQWIGPFVSSNLRLSDHTTPNIGKRIEGDRRLKCLRNDKSAVSES